MSIKEQFLKLYRHEQVEKTPNAMECVALVGQWSSNEYGERNERIRPDVSLDEFGCEWYHGDRAPVPVPDVYVLDDVCDWRDKVTFPDVSSWDWEALAAEELANVDRENQVVMFHSVSGCFERLVAVMGMEEAMIAMVEEPEECKAFFERVADYKIELHKMAARYFKPDVICYADDVATSRGLFIPVEMWREQLKPAHTRIIEEIGKLGIYNCQHCCGKPDVLIGDYVEMGVQSWLPAQADNDLVSVLKEYGDRFVVIGGYDSQGPCAFEGAPDDLIVAEGRRAAGEYAVLGSFAAMCLAGLATGGQPTEDEIRHIVLFGQGFRERCDELGI